MPVEVTMPKFGLTMQEGTIQRYFKTPGESVRAGEPLYEVETEKVLYEVEAPASGTLAAALFPEGATVECGVVIAVIAESGEDAAERLAVFYICIGLGFTGIYFKQPEFLRKTMLSIAPRIRHLIEADQNAKVCPEAYEGADTRNLIEPPGSRMVLMAIIFLGFTLAVLISYFVMYRQSSKNLDSSIKEVLTQDLAAEQSK